MVQNKPILQPISCHHCEGKGYYVIRDCTGEIQREETCSFCRGTGVLSDRDEEE